MPGLCGLIGCKVANQNQVASSINPLNNLEFSLVEFKDGFMAAGHHKNHPLRGKRIYRDRDWLIMFAGDVVDSSTVPYGDILRILNTGNYNEFLGMSGSWCLVAFNERDKLLFLISDLRSQEGLFYWLKGNMIAFSTDMATFCRLPWSMKVSQNFVYEHLFFGFPVGETTFLESAKRMPPATVLKIDISDSFSVDECKYAYLGKKKDARLLSGKDAYDLAFSVFDKRVPLYSQYQREVSCALTGGWDTRTVLAFSPNPRDILAYTYGCKGCSDLINASQVAKRIGLRHRIIEFGKDFESKLSGLLLNTVYLSSGFQRVSRASLLYVYSVLTDFGTKSPIILSGITIGNIFRGHVPIPALVSYDLENIFRGQDLETVLQPWSNILTKGRYLPFAERIKDDVHTLEKYFGDLTSNEACLRYLSYILNPNYFYGEKKIADYFTTLRVPGWDNQIQELAYRIQDSCLRFSRFGSHKRGWPDYRLQAYLLSKKSRSLASVPVRGRISPKAAAHGYLSDLVTQNCFRVLGRRRANRPLENWKVWLNENCRAIVDKLIFGKYSRIQKYITLPYLKRLSETRNTHRISRLLQLEIILRLVENRWNPFWEDIIDIKYDWFTR